MARTVLVELMGPPGAGKSTVFAALRRGDPEIAVQPVLRRRPYAAGFARHLVATMAELAARRAVRRNWSPRDVVMMAYVRALPEAIDRHMPPPATLVFDQGPFYTLSRRTMLHPALAAFWKRWMAVWRDRLDVLVWLEAPAPVLAERIDTRDKVHRLKGADRAAVHAEVQAELDRYGRVLERLEQPGGPLILRFDTSRRPAGEVADEVLRAIGSR